MTSRKVAPTICTGAFYGIREDRDAMGYYRLLVDNLLESSPYPVTVFTNRPKEFDGRADVVEADIDTLANRYWNRGTEERFRRSFERHGRRGVRFPQYANPRLGRLYLAKLGLYGLAAKRHPELFWIDAGLLFSIRYGHTVPERWHGYDPDALTATIHGFEATAGEFGAAGATVHWRAPFWKRGRPKFHGASQPQLHAIARHYGAVPDHEYVCAPLLRYSADWWHRTAPETEEIWETLLDQGVAGTEETVLTVLRWRTGLPTRPLTEWATMLYPHDPPR